MLAGCAGFAAFLPELLGLSDGSVVEVPQLDPRLLVLCGSVNPITLRQMDTAEKAGFYPPAADPPAEAGTRLLGKRRRQRLRWLKLKPCWQQTPLHY